MPVLMSRSRRLRASRIEPLAIRATGRIRSSSNRIFSFLRIDLELPGDHLRADVAEIEPLAARLDRREDLVRLGGGEDELHMLRRLLQRLEQGVERRGGQHVHFVDDVDLVAGPGRAVDGVLPQLADLVDAVVRGPVDLDHVDVFARVDGDATAALEAGGRRGLLRLQAVQRLGEDSRHGGLADAAGAGEQIGVGDPAGLDRVLERPRDRLLPDDVVERLRAVLSCENGVSHGIYY